LFSLRSYEAYDATENSIQGLQVLSLESSVLPDFQTGTGRYC